MKELVIQVPCDIPVWHWTSNDSMKRIQGIIENRGTFDQFNNGVVGHGLYVSSSAIDLMDRGNEVFYAKISSGSNVLVIEPGLFKVGVPELFRMMLKKNGWSDYRYQPVDKKTKEAICADVPGSIDRLLHDLDIPCCVYAFGLYLAFMIRDSSCLKYDAHIEQASTVLKYHREHPAEVPMLAPHLLEQWLIKNADWSSRGIASHVGCSPPHGTVRAVFPHTALLCC
ncbi:MAG: hypothetical protein GY940_22880, partial [bacterium]|nr:hypothetical protein [bacterium]